jgi:polyhydroxyalkanoate synthesis regulator phasin
MAGLHKLALMRYLQFERQAKMTDQVLEILTDLQSRMATSADVAALRAEVTALKMDVSALRSALTALAAHVAPMRAQLDGLPLISRAVTVIQRDLRSLRDDMTVLTAIVMRLDGSHANLLQELHATHAQIVRMNQRVTALEHPEPEHPEPVTPP